jgi:hypothetical protein
MCPKRKPTPEQIGDHSLGLQLAQSETMPNFHDLPTVGGVYTLHFFLARSRVLVSGRLGSITCLPVSTSMSVARAEPVDCDRAWGGTSVVMASRTGTSTRCAPSPKYEMFSTRQRIHRWNALGVRLWRNSRRRSSPFRTLGPAIADRVVPPTSLDFHAAPALLLFRKGCRLLAHFRSGSFVAVSVSSHVQVCLLTKLLVSLEYERTTVRFLSRGKRDHKDSRFQ